MTVYIGGSAISVTRGVDSVNLSELIFSTVVAALRDGNLDIDEVDSVVCACHDLIDGRSLSSMITGPAAGAYMKDEVRLSDDGAAALALAVAKVEAGVSEKCLVVAWGRASEGDVDAISRTAYDPFYHRPFHITDELVSHFRAARWMRVHPLSTEMREQAIGERKARAISSGATIRTSDSTIGWPLRPEELPTLADMVAALVVSRDDGGIRVAGLGQASEPYRPEDRDLVRMPGLEKAGMQALREASIVIADVDIVEIDGLSIFDEAIGTEALGLAAPGSGLASMTMNRRWNATGGSLAGYCPPANGLIRCVSAAKSLLDRGGGIAIATGSGPVAGQTQTVLVLGE